MNGETRSFSVLLAQLEDGRLHDELTDALREIVGGLTNHVIDNGGKPKAKLAMTFNVKLDAGVFEIEADYKLTMPKGSRSRTVFWATPENALTRSNPKQTDMFRDVTGDRETRTVA